LGWQARLFGLPVLLVMLWVTVFLQPFSVSLHAIAHGLVVALGIGFAVRHKRFHRLRGRELLGFWLAYYLVVLLGIALSSDTYYAWVLARKSVYLVTVPFVLAVLPRLPRRVVVWLLLAFVGGCLATFLGSVVRATYRFSMSGNPDVWFYHELALRHSIFVSGYTGASCLLLVALLLQKQGLRGIIAVRWLWLTSGACVVFLFLLSSRMVIAATVACGVFGCLIFPSDPGRRVRTGVFVTALLMAMAMAAVLNPFQGKRITDVQHRLANPTEVLRSVPSGQELDGLSLRLIFWKNGLELWQEAPIWGQGIGDAPKLLENKALAQGLPDPYPHYDTHNQFIQTLVQSGLVGLLVLLAMLMVPAYLAWRRGNRLFTVFIGYFIALNLTATYMNSEVTLTFFVWVAGLLYWQYAPLTRQGVQTAPNPR
jgi:O-antigen ligase